MNKILVEHDVFTRTLDVILNPDCAPERVAAFADFFAHDAPDFLQWVQQQRAQLPALFPSRVVFVDDAAQLNAQIADSHIALVESLAIGQAELDRAPQLRAVQKYGYITRNIDTQACSRRGIPVLTLRRRANMACAEQALMMMLALAKRLQEVDKLTSISRLQSAGFSPAAFDRRHTPASNWARITGISCLFGSTLGIIGLGEIGREIAMRARPFGMRMLYSQRVQLPAEVEADLGVSYVSLEQLMAQSDWIVPQLPATPATEAMLNAAAFQCMKPGARVVNVSRAQVMERSAVIDALRTGHMGGLALDTLWSEPGDDDDELLEFPTVILTPHLAGSPRQNALADFEEMLAGLNAALM